MIMQKNGKTIDCYAPLKKTWVEIIHDSLTKHM